MRPIYPALLVIAFAAISFGQSTETMTVKVYFHNDKLDPDWQDCTQVRPVRRMIPKTQAVATATLQELLKGPTDAESKEFSGFGPPETDGILKSVKVRNGAAYVNFTKAVYRQMGNATSSCGGGFFSMIDATLMQFPTIKKVYYGIESSSDDFYEWVQVGPCPYGKKICSASNF